MFLELVKKVFWAVVSEMGQKGNKIRSMEIGS